MRYLLAIVCCIFCATGSAQDFVLNIDLAAKQKNYNKLTVTITGDSTIELGFAAEKFSRVFMKPGSDESIKWITLILKDTAKVDSAHAVTEYIFSKHRAWKYQIKLEERANACSAGLIYCRQYNYAESGKYSLMLLSYDNSRLTVDYELAGETAAYQCFSLTEPTVKAILAANTASLKITAIKTTSLDSIAADFADKYNLFVTTKENAAQKEQQLDDLRNVVQDMTIVRDTAFTVFLGAPGAKNLPKQVKMYTCTYRKAHNQSSRKQQAQLSDLISTPKSKNDTAKVQSSLLPQKTLAVDSVFLSFSSYVLATVRVYAHENTPEKTLHVFTNSMPLSIASPRALEYTRNALLREEVVAKSGNNIPVIYLKDVLFFDPGKGGFVTDYIPRDTNIILQDKHLSQPVRKPSPASLFRVGVFTDLSGFLDNEAPNGKFQTEVTCIIPMRTKGSRIPISFLRGRSFTWLKTIVPEVCVSKLGDDNRLLQVNVDTNSNTAHVNHFNVYQYVNFWGGGRINLFAIEDRNLNSSCWVNFRFRYMRTQFADTLYNRDRIFTGLSVFYETEIYYKRKMTRNFAIDLSLSAGVIKMYDNSIALSYNTIYGDSRDNAFRPLAALRFTDPDFFKALRSNKVTDRLIVTPMMILKYTKRDSKANGAFIRISFPNSFNNNNGFLMAQIGYIRPFESLFRSGGNSKN